MMASRLETQIANLSVHGCVWLVSPHGHVLRLSRDQYCAMNGNHPALDWTARLDEDAAMALARKRRETRTC